MLLTAPSTTYSHYSNHHTNALLVQPIPNRNHFISQPISIHTFARDFGGNFATSPVNYATLNRKHVSRQISIHAIAREKGDFGGNDTNSTVPSPEIFNFTARNRNHFISQPISIRAIANKNGDFGGNDTNSSVTEEGFGTKGSGSTARGRRLLKVREEKRKRDYDRIHNYPAWAKVLENACKEDTELRAVLGDSIGNPELMKKKVEERVRQKGPNFSKSKTGSVLAFKVSFRDFNPVDSYIWFELYGSPSDRDVELIGNVIQSWYVMGRLGAFNSSNLQLANSSMEYDPLYDADKGSKVMPSSFHDISDVEFQDNWGRVRVDLGTSDILAIDVLLNCLTVLSSEYVGIQQVVFGGRRMGDWEDGMTSPEFGYKYFKM